jgi:hypothetical protein
MHETAIAVPAVYVDNNLEQPDAIKNFRSAGKK